jgi:hypothetical protein
MVSREDFLDWKKNPVTQAFFKGLVDKINEGATELSYTAGDNQMNDVRRAAAIAVYRDILAVELDELEGASDNA